MPEVIVDGESLTFEDLDNVAQNSYEVEISPESIKKLNECRECLLKMIKEGKRIYGVTTGFGALQDVSISFEKVKKSQENPSKSHSAGVDSIPYLTKDSLRYLETRNLILPREILAYD